MSDETKCPRCGGDEFDARPGQPMRCCNCGLERPSAGGDKCPKCGITGLHLNCPDECLGHIIDGRVCLRRQLTAKDAENVRLRAVVEAMAGGDLTLSQTTDGTWQWAGEPADDDMFYRWRGAYTTAADAALAGLAELGKDKTT